MKTNTNKGGNMLLTGIVETIDCYMDVNVLAVRIDDDYHLVQDREDLGHKFWVNPDYLDITY